jgi:succinylglutamate desuccinylase
MTTKNDTLIIVATHGDEKIGIEAINILRQKGISNFDVLIGNPKALEENKRFIDTDLNRSYPGNSMSNKYEEVLAVENFEIAKKYKYVIDMHEASFGQDNFIIVPKETLPKDFPLNLLNLEKVLLWPDPKGPMTQFLENGVELEFGMKDKPRQDVLSQAVQIVEGFLLSISGKKLPAVANQEVFYVYGYLSGEKSDAIGLRDFEEAESGGEKFLPLLTGQYLNSGIVCYKMRAIKVP